MNVHDFRTVFKRVVISGKEGTGKPMLAHDMGFKPEQCKAVDAGYIPNGEDICLIYTNDTPIKLDGYICVHLDFISQGVAPFK